MMLSRTSSTPMALLAMMIMSLAGCAQNDAPCRQCDAGGSGCDTICTSCDATCETCGADLAPNADGAEPAVPSVVINELVCQPELGSNDWIELKNVGEQAADVGGLILTDGIPVLEGYRLPDGTTIEAGGYLILFADGTGVGLHTTFALGSGESLGLYLPNGLPIDETNWAKDAAPQGSAWGRWPDGSGTFTKLDNPTPGEANQGN